MLNASVLALTLLAGQTWTVSNDGRADFSEISDAIADERVALGDVLLVSPGEYEGFTLDRKLTIVGGSGDSRPMVTEPVTVMTMTKEFLPSGGAFSFGYVDFLAGVTVEGSDSPGQFDNCRLFGTTLHPSALRVVDAAEVMLSRCVLVGADVSFFGKRSGVPQTGHGVEAVNSNVIFVDSSAQGGHGAIGPGLPPHPGGNGLLLKDGSKVLMAGGSMLGGSAGGTTDPCDLGAGGNGLLLQDSFADLRGFGANDDAVLPSPPAPCGPLGFSVLATGPTSQIRLGGPIGIRGVQAPPNALQVTKLLQPYLQNFGDATPGSSNVLQLRGEPNQYAVFFGSLDPSESFVFEVDMPVGFNPFDLFFVGALVTPSQALAPADCPYDVPEGEPILNGVTARFQCVMQDQPAEGMPTKATASNPVDVVVRF